MRRVTPLARELLDLALPRVREYGLILLDPQGMIVGWLAGAQEVLGYAPEEIVGCNGSVLFVPEDLEKGMDTYELEAARRTGLAQDDRWHLRSDGTRIWVSGTVTALRSETGELRGFIKLLRDRTDQRIGTENRAKQLAALEEAMERTQRFLQTLGHELRNPLAPIKNSAFILPRLSDDPRVHKVAKMIDAQATVLQRLAEDLTEVSRLHQRKLRLELSERDVRELLQEEVAAQMLPARAKGLKLQAVLPDKPVTATVDRDRLRQAVSNLLTNAIKYTPEGGTVWAKVFHESDEVVIRVEDTGIGISCEALPRIFELFTQESRAQDMVPGGLGVGLSIVKQIAELHGGMAQARSGGAGQGAEFTLRIPREGPPSHAG